MREASTSGSGAMTTAQTKRIRARVLARFTRWTAERKHDLLVAIKHSIVSIEDACEAHNLTAEEIARWQQAFAAGGIDALRVSRRAA